MTPRSLPHDPDLVHLRRLGAHARAGSALSAAVSGDPASPAATVRLLAAAAAALRDELGERWATGEDDAAVARLLVDGQLLGEAWTAAATHAAALADADHAAAIARVALWPCVLAAWAGGEVAAAGLDAAERLAAHHPHAAAPLVPAVAQLRAALVDDDTQAAVTLYEAWVSAVDTPAAAVALHQHLPALLGAASTADVTRFDAMAARRVRHHEARARRRRRDPASVLDLLAVVTVTTAHRHGIAPAVRLPYLPTLLPGEAR